MTDQELLIEIERTGQRQQEILDFYDLAEKYGFCTPWCHIKNDCDMCEKRENSPMV